MTDEAMSPLRRRMIEDMTIRKLAPKTQQGYIRAIKDFAAFLGRSPDTASFEDVRRFQLHLAARATSQSKARLRQHPTSWHSRAGGGAVHSIKLGQRRSTSVLKRKTPRQALRGAVGLSYKNILPQISQTRCEYLPRRH